MFSRTLGSYCYQALSANKVASGLPDGSFGINDPTTRAQFSAFFIAVN
ncbi:S-layer homology domain-containing protein [Anaerobacillus sp. HL2]|nr:S-layer homology domain-containing protein [Anaerobacillus sp. HL2]